VVRAGARVRHVLQLRPHVLALQSLELKPAPCRISETISEDLERDYSTVERAFGVAFNLTPDSEGQQSSRRQHLNTDQKSMECWSPRSGRSGAQRLV